MQISLFPDKSLFAVMVIFIINYFVVRRFFLKPINDVLEAREHETKTSDELYSKAMERFNEATSHVESKLHEAKRDAAGVREKFRGEAATHRVGLVERTTTEARRMIDEADTKLKADLTAARDRIVKESEALARTAAERILGRSV